MKRLAFDLNRPDADDAPDLDRPRGSARCAAHGCRFAGSIGDSSHASSWWCAHHYGAQPDDLPRITQAMAAHRSLVDIVLDGRRASNRAAHRDIAGVWASLRRRHAALGLAEPRNRNGDAYPTFAGWLAGVEVQLGDVLRPATTARREVA